MNELTARDKPNFPDAALKLPRSTMATKTSISRNLSILTSQSQSLANGKQK